ncbi:MAG: hypothetical protein H7338_23710 [Candidatus Sericytochromatia bacterium]|nr:hypothetical protein [Candidatus Sericytochromatia bacterium]
MRRMVTVPLCVRWSAAAFVAATLTLSPLAWAEDDAEAALAARRPNPWIAGLLSLVVPGLGQFYAGERERALLILGGGIAVVLAKIVTNQLVVPDPVGAAPRSRAPIEAVDLIMTLALPTYWAWSVGDAVRIALPPNPSDILASPSPLASPSLPPPMRP